MSSPPVLPPHGLLAAAGVVDATGAGALKRSSAKGSLLDALGALRAGMSSIGIGGTTIWAASWAMWWSRDVSLAGAAGVLKVGAAGALKKSVAPAAEVEPPPNKSSPKGSVAAGGFGAAGAGAGVGIAKGSAPPKRSSSAAGAGLGAGGAGAGAGSPPPESLRNLGAAAGGFIPGGGAIAVGVGSGSSTRSGTSGRWALLVKSNFIFGWLDVWLPIPLIFPELPEELMPLLAMLPVLLLTPTNLDLLA
mmetsp:Transcript_95254/g.164383  ORF Transcript_95254/g.164383 Transcript_95254/m.164383 type:complete len:248 (+) Transcript_95254:1576-2319(+)